MSWKAYPYKDFLYPFLRRRAGARNLRGVFRGIRRGTRSVLREARPRTHRRWFCCCPVFFALGLASLGAFAGLLYVGIRFLGWA
jgi:hypothetical protein